jgi:hypothetical protein
LRGQITTISARSIQAGEEFSEFLRNTLVRELGRTLTPRAHGRGLTEGLSRTERESQPFRARKG